MQLNVLFENKKNTNNSSSGKDTVGVWRVQLIFDLRRLGWVRLQQWLLCDSKSRTVMHLLMLCVPESVPRWVCLSHHHLWESDLWETTFTWVLKVKSKPSNITLTSEGQQLQPLMNSITQWEWKWPFLVFLPSAVNLGDYNNNRCSLSFSPRTASVAAVGRRPALLGGSGGGGADFFIWLLW